MTEIILHIGAGKTGTTAIQNFLAYNRDRLAENGILYPDLPGWDATQPGVAHNPLAYALMCGTTGADLAAARAALEKAADRAERIVLSAEVFYMRPWEGDFGGDFDRYAAAKERGIEATAELLSGFTVRPACYVRRQDEWLESLYQERIKSWKPVEDDPATFADQLREPHFLWQLDLWARHFGDDNMCVRPYERPQFEDGDLVSDFLRGTGLPPRSALRVPPETPHTANPRFIRDVFELQRILTNLATETNDRQTLRDALSELSERERARRGDDPPGWATLLSPPQRRRILDRYRTENETVARRFLQREHGRLFTERNADDAQEGGTYPGLTAARATQLALELERIRTHPRYRAARAMTVARTLVHRYAAWMRPAISPVGRMIERLRQRRRRGY